MGKIHASETIAFFHRRTTLIFYGPKGREPEKKASAMEAFAIKYNWLRRRDLNPQPRG